jgi:hypothetical protein
MDDYHKLNLELKSLFDEIDLLKRFKFVGLYTCSAAGPSPSQPCSTAGGLELYPY